MRDSLVFDPGRSYDYKSLKQLLDDATYTDREKINFISAAISNNSKDLFCTIETEVIEYWHKNVQAQLLMVNYFMKLACDQSDDPGIHFRYFDFVTINALPGTTEMIEEYIKSRPFLKIQYPDEIKLIHRLIRAGSEKSALDFLQLLVTEYTGNKGYECSWGQRDENSNVFDLLCFSNNNIIRAQAIQLLWTCLDKEIDADLFDLGSYLDEKRATRCLHKRFQDYTTFDLGKIEPADLNKTRYSRKEPPVISSYFHFMRYFSLWLGKAMGKRLWTEFMNRMPYWDYYKGCEKFIYQAIILEEVFKDSSITEKERRQMLFDIKIGSLNVDDLNLRNFSCNARFNKYNILMGKYLKLVRQAYPDGNIGEDDSTKLYLRHIKKWIIADQVYSNAYVNMAAAVADLTGLVSHFDPPYSYNTVSNKELFNLHFEPLLAKKGITDIDVQEITVSIPNKKLNKIFVRSKDAVYVREYVAVEYGQDQVHKLVKMINLLLMKKNIKERLIAIKDTEYTVDYGIFEPEKLKVFLDKNNVYSNELDKVSRLINLQ